MSIFLLTSSIVAVHSLLLRFNVDSCYTTKADNGVMWRTGRQLAMPTPSHSQSFSSSHIIFYVPPFTNIHVEFPYRDGSILRSTNRYCVMVTFAADDRNLGGAGFVTSRLFLAGGA